jgi:kynurenine formamidase
MSKTRWIYLSHALGQKTPAYGGGEGFYKTIAKSMAKGDSCNTERWTFSNHLGTHTDFPRHFTAHGRTIDDYPLSFFMFSRIGFADMGQVAGGRIISRQDLEPMVLPEDIEILLIKTGFSHKRSLPAYWQENPGFSPDLADWLREAFPSLRVLGFDSISLSSFSHRDLGRQAHKRFLDHERPILPLEDMDLSGIGGASRLKQVIVAPWVVRGADAVQCTVMAEICDEN